MKRYQKRFRDWSELPIVINLTQLCIILDCCDRTAVKLLKSGEIQGRQVGHQWYIDRESVQRFVGNI